MPQLSTIQQRTLELLGYYDASVRAITSALRPLVGAAIALAVRLKRRHFGESEE